MNGTGIRYTSGDATAPTADGVCIIAHVCNDIGGWGKGFVRAVSARWPAPERAYRHWYRHRDANDFGLGAVQLVEITPELYVANMIGQHGIASAANPTPIRYEALEQCLTRLADHALVLQASIHAPRLGAGLAGGEWPRVADLITARLCDREIAVTIYDLP